MKSLRSMQVVIYTALNLLGNFKPGNFAANPGQSQKASTISCWLPTFFIISKLRRRELTALNEERVVGGGQVESDKSALDRTQILVSGDLLIDRQSAVAILDNVPLQLSAKPFAVLYCLMANAGSVVTKDNLINEVWDGKAVSDAVLTSAIKTIRHALRDQARSPEYILTVHGRGYKFLKPVAATAQPDETVHQTGDGPFDASQATRRTGFHRHVNLWVGIAGAVALLALIALLIPGSGNLYTSTPAGPAAITPERSIAVLPFDDYSESQDLAWFAAGLAEEILDQLAGAPDLKVASRRSSFRFTKPDHDIRDIAAALDVAYLIEGSVRDSGNVLTITAQLIRASDGYHVWSQSFDRTATADDMIAIQREISAAIADRLSVRLPEDSAARSRSTTAYQAYRAGISLSERRNTADIKQAQAEFETAISADPEFGAAYAGLAEAILLDSAYMGEDQDNALNQAALHVGKALELAPSSSVTLRAAAFLELANRNFDRALAHADRAVLENRNDALAHQRRGVILINMGQITEAARAYREGLVRDPLSPILIFNLLQLELKRDNVEAASALAQRNKQYNPGHTLTTSGFLSLSEYQGNYLETARTLTQVLAEDANNQYIRQSLARIYWRLGLFDDAARLVDQPYWYISALIALSLGDHGKATELLQKERPVRAIRDDLVISYYLHRHDEAAELAKRNAVRYMLLDDVDFAERHRGAAIAVMNSLRIVGDPDAELIESSLGRYYSELDPAKIVSAEDLYIGAVYFAAIGDTDRTLIWLGESLQRGHIPREITLDPVFDTLRDTEEFRALITAMEENAANIRIMIAPS